MLINGRAYDWSMITFEFGNVTATPVGITSIKYNSERKIENIYGVGPKPVARGKGNYTYTGSITMDMNTVTELRAASTDSTLEGLGEFDFIITYNHPTQGKTVVDTLKSCTFSEDGVDVSQDDTSITKEYNLNPADMELDDSSVVS